MGYVFVEIDMRNDFADDPRAVLPVPGTYALVGKMHVLESLAELLIEVHDDHSQDDPVSKEEFKTFPPHCVRGTWGHERIGGLYTPKEKNKYRRYAKNSYDAWKGKIGGSKTDKAEIERFTKILCESERIVVGGLVTGICVNAFLDGIIAQGLAKKTVVISD
jgi:nicotinamidase-related amidase